MGIAVANAHDNSLLYAGKATALQSQAIVWGGAFFRLDSTADDDTIISINDSAADNFNSGILVFRDLSGGGTHAARIFATDVFGNPCDVAAVANTHNATNVWYRVLWAIEIITGGTAKVSLWAGTDAVVTATKTYNNSGSVVLVDDDIRIGSRIKLSAGDERPMNGDIEDAFICYGAMPTAGEITDLQTKTARVALASSSSTLHLDADLIDETFVDRIGSVVPTSVITPPRVICKDIDYNRSPTLAIVGDPQHLDATGWPTLRDAITDFETAMNIKAVLCMGDWSHNTTSAEFVRARDAVDTWVTAGLPVYGPPGNHDLNTTTLDMTTMKIATNLPMTVFSGQATFDEAYTGVTYDTDAYVHSAFLTVDATDDWLYINLPAFINDDQLDWVIAKCSQHREKPVIIVSHLYLNSAGDLYDDSDTGAGEDDQYAPSVYGAGAWENPGGTVAGAPDGWWLEKLKSIPNLACIFCGHDIIQQATRKVALLPQTGINGNQLLSAYVNNQEQGTGGDGFAVMLEVTPTLLTGKSFLLNLNQSFDGANSDFSQSIAAVTTDLKVLLKLDETSGTTAANFGNAGTYDGTLSGGVDFATDSVAGKFGNALQLNGTSDYIDLGNVSIGTTAMTVAFHIKNLTDTAALRYFLDGISDRRVFAVRDTDQLAYYDSAAWHNFGIPPFENVWHHFVITLDGTVCKAYIDGVQFGATKAVVSTNWSSAQNVKISRKHDTSQNFVPAILDDYRIYSRALTEAEVLVLATNPYSNPYTQQQLMIPAA